MNQSNAHFLVTTGIHESLWNSDGPPTSGRRNNNFMIFRKSSMWETWSYKINNILLNPFNEIHSSALVSSIYGSHLPNYYWFMSVEHKGYHVLYWLQWTGTNLWLLCRPCGITVRYPSPLLKETSWREKLQLQFIWQLCVHWLIDKAVDTAACFFTNKQG